MLPYVASPTLSQQQKQQQPKAVGLKLLKRIYKEQPLETLQGPLETLRVPAQACTHCFAERV